MGRPKAESGQPNAKQRLVESYWELMENGPYEDITITSLCSKAKVNHNTFYYHFDNIEALSLHAFREEMSPTIAEDIFTILNNQEEGRKAMENPIQQKSIRRVMRWIARTPDTIRETCMVEIANHWLYPIGKSFDDLTDEENVQLRYIVGGMIYALKASCLQEEPEMFGTMLQGHLGSAIYQTFIDMFLSEARQ